MTVPEVLFHKESVVVNSWIHDKHGDQGGPLGQKYSRVRDVYIRGPFFRIFHHQSDHIVWIYSSRFVSPQTHNLNFVPGIISGTKRDYTCTTCVEGKGKDEGRTLPLNGHGRPAREGLHYPLSKQ